MSAKAAVKNRRVRTAEATADIPRAAYTVSEFCAAHRISEGFYYKLKLQGLAPRETRLLGKILISMEDAAAWRKARVDDDTAADE
jgi:hypothetical protein